MSGKLTRLIAMLCAFVMLFSSMPASVFAEGFDEAYIAAAQDADGAEADAAADAAAEEQPDADAEETDSDAAQDEAALSDAEIVDEADADAGDEAMVSYDNVAIPLPPVDRTVNVGDEASAFLARNKQYRLRLNVFLPRLLTLAAEGEVSVWAQITEEASGRTERYIPSQNGQSLSATWLAAPGTYLIVFSAVDPAQEGSFRLSVRPAETKTEEAPADEAAEADAEEVIADGIIEAEAAVDESAADEAIADEIIEAEAAVDESAAEEVIADATIDDEAVADEAVEDEIIEDEGAEDEVIEDEAAADEVVADDIIEDEVIEDKIIEDDSTEDEVIEEEVIVDEVIEDEAAEDVVIADEIIEDDSTEEEVIEDETTEDEAIEDETAEDETNEDENGLTEEAADAVLSDAGYAYSFHGIEDYTLLTYILVLNGIEYGWIESAGVSDESLAMIDEDLYVVALDYFDEVTLAVTVGSGETVGITLKNPAPDAEIAPVDVDPEDITVTVFDADEKYASLMPSQETPLPNASRTLPGEMEKKYTRNGLIGLDIQVDDGALAEGSLYLVPVTLETPIDLMGGLDRVRIDSCDLVLYHDAGEGNVEQIEQVRWTAEDGVLTGFTFETDGFSSYIVAYTVVFHYEGRDYTCTLPGAQDMALSEILCALEIVSPEDASLFLEKTETVEASDPAVLRLTRTEEDWTVRVLRESENDEFLTVRMQDGRKYRIAVTAVGVTEIAAENDAAVISTVNGLYLPPDASAYAEAGNDPDGAAVSAVLARTADGETDVSCQVFSIGLTDVDASEYEGFDIAVNLEKSLVGRDFRLYQVQNGDAQDITFALDLNGESAEDGVRTVSGFRFTADRFADFVLSYTIVTYYTAFDGASFRIALTYGPEAGIPEDAELKAREILADDGEYEAYYRQAAEAAALRDDTDCYARIFDIEIWADEQKIEPAAPVSVCITLADAPALTDGGTAVVHFGQDGPVVLAAEAKSDSEIEFTADAFSVYAVITTPGPQGVNGLDGLSFTLDRGGRYVTSTVNYSESPYRLGKTDNSAEAAVWTFESAGASGQYYLSTESNGQIKYLNIGYVYGSDSFAHATLSDDPQAITVLPNGDGTYTFAAESNGRTYYLNEWYGTDGNGFAGYTGQVDDEHLTVNFTQTLSSPGNAYAVIVKDEATDTYYAVQNDGSLAEVEYSE